MKLRLIFGVVCLLAATGCATQRYGRMQEVSDAEARLLTCAQIELEIAKTETFLKDVVDQNKKLTGKDVLGFLGDFGIGNSMEFKEAMESGSARLFQLRALHAKKGCGDAAAGQAPASS